MALGRWDEGRAALDAAHTALVRGHGLGHPAAAATASLLADALATEGRPDDAVAVLIRTIRHGEQALRDVLAVVSERQRLVYLDEARTRVDQLLSMNALAGWTPASAREALDLVLRHKGLSLDADYIIHLAAATGERPEARAALDRLDEARHLAGYKLLAGPGPEGVSQHERVLAELEQRQRDAEADLARSVPGLAEAVRPAGLAAVAAAIPPSTALIEIVAQHRPGDVGQPGHYVAFILGHGRDTPDIADLGPVTGIDAQVRECHRRITRSAFASLAGSVIDPLCNPQQTWYDKPQTSASHWIIVPDGQLAAIPIDVLPIGPKLLIDERSVSYLASGRDLLRRTRETPAAAPPLVVGAPDYDLADPGATTPQAPRLSMTFPALCRPPYEAEEVAAILGVTPLAEGKALKSAVREYRSPRVLHINTHGYFPASADDVRGSVLKARRAMLNCGLALAGANTWARGGAPPPEAENGLLTAEDVLTMTMHGTDLVTLSACGTGLGASSAGEGMFGLRRAFLIAGADTLLISMWKVPANSTAHLMTAFTGISKQASRSSTRYGGRRPIPVAHIHKFATGAPSYWLATPAALNAWF